MPAENVSYERMSPSSSKKLSASSSITSFSKSEELPSSEDDVAGRQQGWVVCQASTAPTTAARSSSLGRLRLILVKFFAGFAVLFCLCHRSWSLRRSRDTNLPRRHARATRLDMLHVAIQTRLACLPVCVATLTSAHIGVHRIADMKS
jgi:hypothetical protein